MDSQLLKQLVTSENPTVTETRNMVSDALPLVCDRENKSNPTTLSMEQWTNDMKLNDDLFIQPKITEVRCLDDHVGCIELEINKEEELAETVEIFGTSKISAIMNRQRQDNRIKCDGSYTPCGCLPANMDLYSMPWYGEQVFVPQVVDWDRAVHKHHNRTVLCADGLQDPDICWCDLQDPHCPACEPFFSVLRGSGNPDFWTFSSDSFIDALDHSTYFSYGHYTLAKERRDDVWDDEFLCIQYNGPYKQPRTYHVRYFSNVFQFRSHTVGALVPNRVFEPHLYNEVEYVDIGRTVPAMYQTLDQVPKLTTLAGIATSRLPHIPENVYKILTDALIDFKVGDEYLLPIGSDKVFDEIAEMNKFWAAYNNQKLPQIVTACGDEDTSVGELSIQQDQQHNVDLAETTESSDTYVASEPFPLLPWITEEKHEYPDLTGRWTKAFSFQWTTAQLQGVITQRYDLPIEAIQAFRNSPNALPWTQHAFYRADMELKIQVNSQPAQSGYLAVGVMYNASEATAIGGRVDSVANIVQMPHNRISAGASNSGVIHIPFVRQYPVGCVLNNNFDVPQYVATLFVAPLLQLRTGPDGPQTVDVTVMIRFPRCEFFGQRNRVEVVTATGYRTWVPDLTICGDVESNPGPFLSTIMAGVGMLGKVGLIAGKVANAIGSFGSAAGQISQTSENLLRKVYPKEDADRPQNIREPLNLYMQQNTSLSLATGTNVVKLLQLQAENMVSHPPGHVPSDDQFSNDFIARSFGIIDFTQWSTDQASGTSLWSYNVSPLRPLINDDNTYYPTPMSALGSYYSGYHGDILLRFTFGISKFHSGRVYIVYSPDSTIDFENVGSYYGVLLDIQDQSQYVFQVPYQVPTTFAPMYAEPVGWRGFDNSIGDSLVVSYGTVHVFVENQLRAMQTATPVIDILVEQAGAPNFHYVMPAASHGMSLPTVVTATGVESAPDVQEEVKETDERKQVEIASTNVRQIFPTWAISLNESHDIRDLVKRYTPWFDVVSLPVSTAENSTFQNSFTTVTVLFIPNPPFFAQLAGWGPITNVEFQNVPTSTLIRTNLAAKSGVIIARERINMQTNNTISFRVPWTSIASMLSNSLNPTSTRPNQLTPYCNGRVVVVVEPNVTSLVNSEFGAQYLAWDVTAGSASERDDVYVPDLVTLLHDGFRFTKADFNYQLDVQLVRTPEGWCYRMRCHRALGDGGNFYVFQGFPKMRGNYRATINGIGGVTPVRGGLARQQPGRSGWVRDLTQDGDVESNPGPVVEEPLPDPSSDRLSSKEIVCLGRGQISADLFERVGGYCTGVLKWSLKQTLQLLQRLSKVMHCVGKLPGIRSITSLVQTVEQLEEVSSSINGATGAMRDLAQTIEATSKKVNTFISSVQERGKADIARMISSGIEYVALIVNVWNSQSTGMCLLNIAALLSKMGLCELVVNSLVDRMGDHATADDDQNHEREYVSLFITSVLTSLGLANLDYSNQGWKDKFLTKTADFFRNGFNVKKFLDSHFGVIGDICNWVKTKVFGKMDKGGLSEDLIIWCEKVHKLCEVYNYDNILSDPEYADLVLALQDEAFEFDRLFLTARVRPPNQYSIYRTKLQKAVDVLGQQGTMHKSKPTPFCVWVYGKSGSGKSYICDNVLIEMGDALGLSTANAIYTRSPDTEYWNGYVGQKLISWQDFAKITTGENYRKQVSELSSLIEPTPFNPPFAALDDKRKLADAWAVYVSSNKAFPDVQSIGMVDSILFYRRRHLLVQMRLKPSIIAEYSRRGIILEGTLGNQNVYMPSNIPIEDYASRGPFFHVEFGLHASGFDTLEPTEWLGYDDFIAQVRSRAVDHRTKEIQACAQRRREYARLRRAAPTGMEFRENVRSAKEELERMQTEQTTTATADETEPGPSTSDPWAGIQQVNLETRRKDPNYCQHEKKVYIEDVDGGRIFYIEVCDDCDLSRERKNKVFERYHQGTEYDDLGHSYTNQEGSLPSGTAKYSPLDYANQIRRGLMSLFGGKTLPSGYAHWSEVMPICCHNKDILQLAYFEKVAGNVELVVDMSELFGNCGPNLIELLGSSWHEILDIRSWRIGSRMYKLILPTHCEQSKFTFLNRLQSYPQAGVRTHIIPMGIDLSRPWVCNAVTKPTVEFYRLNGEAIQYLIKQDLVEVMVNQELVEGLNYTYSVFGREDPVTFCNTFFHWKCGGRTRCAQIYPFANAVTKDVMTVWKLIAGTIAVVTAAYGIYRLVRNSNQMVTAEGASQSGDIRKTETTTAPRVNFVQQQPSVVTATSDDKLAVIHSNFCKFSKGTMSVFGVRLCNTYILAPLHLSWQEGDFVVNLHHKGVWSGSFTASPSSVKIASIPGYDYAIYHIPALPAARNILNYFTTRPQSNTLRSESQLLSLAGAMLTSTNIRIVPYRGVFNYDNFDMKQSNMVGWQYHVGPGSKTCGSLVFSNNLLCGMHVAMNFKTGHGYAFSLCKEMLVDALRLLGASDIDMRLHRHTPKVEGGEPLMQPPSNVVLIPVGKADKPVTYSGKSNLEPSPIQGEVSEPFRYPAAQCATATGKSLGYDIVMKGCVKQFNPPKALSPVVVEEIAEYLIERIVESSPPVIPTDNKPLGLDTAILGVEGVPLMCSMKLNTSIGWPLCTKYPAGYKKRNIISVNEDRTEIGIDQVAYEDYLAANEMRRRAECCPTVFMDFPKDELLKPGKDTRLINGANLNHTLDMRRYLMEFFAAITRLDNKIAVGIDVHSGDWALVHNGTDDVVDEDYSGFGPGFHSEWMLVVAKLAAAWCKRYKQVDEEYLNVVRALIEECKNAYHIAGDLVYQVWCGSPSGAYATDRINSLANLCYHAYCYKQKYGTLTGFWQGYCLVYGDDTRREEKLYTADEFRVCMEQIGIKVTQDKSGVTSFLKRQFVPFRYKNVEVMLAPLPLPIVGDIINWVRKPYVSAIDAVVETVDSYLSEIFHHGPDVFNNSRSAIQGILARYGRNPELKTFDDYFRVKYLTNGPWPVFKAANERGALLAPADSCSVNHVVRGHDEEDP